MYLCTYLLSYETIPLSLDSSRLCGFLRHFRFEDIVCVEEIAFGTISKVALRLLRVGASEERSENKIRLLTYIDSWD